MKGFHYFDMTDEQRHKKAEGWVIRNLQCYGNSLVPKELVKRCKSQKKTAELIEWSSGMKVKVSKGCYGDYIAEAIR